ncbi:MAG: hypothetical protein FWB96_01200 [Defluviitaleaceae bacterium]|nr:hypothetical protein [Defluviitaleaceae bacterium]MCL2261691.1 hypothetical protein [Defluviitaleaceae bacterium]
MSDLIKRFHDNAPRMEKQKTVDVEGIKFTISPISYIDRMRIQSTIQRSTDGAVILRGDEVARENLYIASNYAMEFKRVNPETLNELGCNSVAQFVEGVLSHAGIGELCHEIDKFTSEVQDEHDAAVDDAAKTAGD